MLFWVCHPAPGPLLVFQDLSLKIHLERPKKKKKKKGILGYEQILVNRMLLKVRKRCWESKTVFRKKEIPHILRD